MQTQIPKPLLNSLNNLEGFDESAFLNAHLEENKITSIRLNPFKKTELAFEFAGRVSWADDAWYLKTRPFFTNDPLFHAGCYYVQEAGSMFLEFVLKNTVDLLKPLSVLDLCGAPGGKSTLINSVISAESLLVSNEVVKNRAGILVQNLGKWGTCNTVVTNNDPGKFSGSAGFFDVLVVDAPCSGSGLFRKQPEAIAEWSEDLVNHCSTRQRVILEDALPCLKEDGVLIYSTCSYSVKENEDIVNYLVNELDMEYLPLPVPREWGIVDTGAGYRFYPHLLASEGFFCAALRKRTSGKATFNPKKIAVTEATKAEKKQLEHYLDQGTLVMKKNGQFHELNPAAAGFLSAFEKQLYFKKAGRVVGEIKGKDLVPNQELAWKPGLQNIIPALELDPENALSYLRKDPFTFGRDSKGLVLITFKGFGLGWAKILPTRVNNYLPGELRILSRKL